MGYHHRHVGDAVSVRFDNAAGADEAEQEMEEAVERVAAGLEKKKRLINRMATLSCQKMK